MNRRDLLKRASLAGLATFAISKGYTIENARAESLADCVIIPSETAGPFPLDLSKDATKFRQAINENRAGVPLKVILTVVNVNDNCSPIANARLDLWHNDKEGDYSGFSQFDSRGEKWCRGIQMTDAAGQVTFTTIYPGWYPGRVTHMHFSVFLNSRLEATSQLAFPDSLNEQVYANNPTLYTKGPNSTVASNQADAIFASPSGALARQITTVVDDDATGGYIAGLIVPIAVPVASLNNEPETGGQFILEQNYPNPFAVGTSIPFKLPNGGRVSLAIFNTSGVEVASVPAHSLGSGRHAIELQRVDQFKGLPSGNYIYQFMCENAFGRFMQCKVMTLSK